MTGTPQRPKCLLPKSLCLAPSRPLILRTSRLSDPSYVPLSFLARFEQRVPHGHGPAQVGFDVRHHLLSHLTVCRLSPEPWRLTHPERVEYDCATRQIAPTVECPKLSQPGVSFAPDHTQADAGCISGRAEHVRGPWSTCAPLSMLDPTAPQTPSCDPSHLGLRYAHPDPHG